MRTIPLAGLFAISMIVRPLVVGAQSDQDNGASQRPSVALHYTVEATYGGSRGRGGEFTDRDLGGARIATGIRLFARKRIGAFVEVAADLLDSPFGRDRVSICTISSRGGCVPYYPTFLGFPVVAGVIAQPAQLVEVRGGVGGGPYTAGGTTVGAVIGQFDIGLFAPVGVGFVAGVRSIVVPRYRHDRLSLVPWMFGIRLR